MLSAILKILWKLDDRPIDNTLSVCIMITDANETQTRKEMKMVYEIISYDENGHGTTHERIEARDPQNALMLADSVPAEARDWPFVDECDVDSQLWEGSLLNPEDHDQCWSAVPVNIE